MAEQEQTVTERRGGAHRGWEKVPPPQGLAQRPGPAITRQEGAAPGQMSWLSAQIQGLWDAWGTGQEGETGSAVLLPACSPPLPLPWAPPSQPVSLSWTECLFSSPPFTLQSHIKYHLIPSFLHSLIHFIQSAHGEASLGPVFQGTPQGTHSRAGEMDSYKHTQRRQSDELGWEIPQALGIRREFPEKVRPD